MKTYLNRFEADMSGATPDEILLLRVNMNASKKPSPNGIYYFNGSNDVVVLTTPVEEDLLHAVRAGYWDHSKNVQRIREGTLVYLLPSKGLLDEKPHLKNFGLKGIAKAPMFKIQDTDPNWKKIA